MSSMFRDPELVDPALLQPKLIYNPIRFISKWPANYTCLPPSVFLPTFGRESVR